MQTKFSEDVIPLSDVKVNPGKIVKQVSEGHRPALLTSRGRGVAVVQAVADFEADQEERHFLRGVVQGMQCRGNQKSSEGVATEKSLSGRFIPE